MEVFPAIPVKYPHHTLNNHHTWVGPLVRSPQPSATSTPHPDTLPLLGHNLQRAAKAPITTRNYLSTGFCEFGTHDLYSVVVPLMETS